MQLVNDDCFEYLKNVTDKSVDLIVTDPPYERVWGGDGGSVNNIKHLHESLQDIVRADIVDGYDIEEVNNEFVRVMKEINIYLWCNKKQIPEYFNFYVNKHKCKFEIICWHKNNALPTYSNKYLSDTEYCLYFHKGKGKTKPKGYEQAKTYYVAPINYKDKQKWKHPTIKPLEIIKNLVENSSSKGDVVMDPFMGSGTTGVACKELEREFIGCELNKEYFDIAKSRIEETGLEKQEVLI